MSETRRERGHYVKTTEDARQRVLQAYERGEDAYAVGYAHGMKRSLYNYAQHINAHLRKALVNENMFYGL